MQCTTYISKSKYGLGELHDMMSFLVVIYMDINTLHYFFVSKNNIIITRVEFLIFLSSL
jgi:hypothetical protein